MASASASSVGDSAAAAYGERPWPGGPIFSPFALVPLATATAATAWQWMRALRAPSPSWPLPSASRSWPTLRARIDDAYDMTLAGLLAYNGLASPLQLHFEHRVNRTQRVEEVLANASVHGAVGVMELREQQVYMGSTNENTLDAWLRRVTAEDVPVDQRKALVIQVTSVECAARALPVLRARMAHMRRRTPMLWVGADILPCTDESVSKVPHEKFVPLALTHLHDVPLSLGWTYDERSHGVCVAGEPAESMQELQTCWWRAVKVMHAAVRPLLEACPRREITFTVEACLAGHAVAQLVWLVKQNPRLFTLTVWHLDKCAANAPGYLERLTTLRDALPPGTLLFDGPEVVWRALMAQQ